MNRLILTLLTMAMAPLSCIAGITLDYCLSKAEENYPLIKRYALVEKTADLNLSDINKGWLPRIGVYGQVSAQNAVPAFPAPLQEILSKLGQETDGLGHIQYKIGADVSQTIWDGGASRAQRKVERASAAQTQASLSVQMYAVREKVMNLFFGILLIDKQIEQTENTISLLTANRTLMESMLKNGTAMQADIDMIEAQRLSMSQTLTQAKSTEKAYRDLLAIYIGENLDNINLEKPEAEMPADLGAARPELNLFESQRSLNRARETAVKSSVMPRIGLFAQAYYGYPGLNYFESMISRDFSFNVLAGVKLSWNLDSFYTKKNSLRKLAIANEGIENDREVFLFHTRLQTSSQTETIDGLRAIMSDDARIVDLRSNVRKAAESRLRNGVIDATALLVKITDENQARLTAAYHEIQLIQSIYKLKNIINR